MLKLPINIPFKNVGHHYRVLDKVLKRIPKAVLYGDSKEDLCFQALMQFDFKPPLINQLAELGNAASLILALMGFDDDFFEKDELRDKKPLDRFMHYFLELKDMPGGHLS
ncbi:MAG: hypothetical protein EOO01_29640, partial [Chitinophagaceae bacterium]